ncbi:MAG: hypothetical protein KKD33_06480, partial [Verrucomicrobia bacterium]|nr:hypothetical protein [Verrucomicrobiota bacterium]
ARDVPAGNTKRGEAMKSYKRIEALRATVKILRFLAECNIEQEVIEFPCPWLVNLITDTAYSWPIVPER